LITEKPFQAEMVTIKEEHNRAGYYMKTRLEKYISLHAMAVS